VDDSEFYTFRGYQMLKQDKSQLTASMEDYLEMIYRNCMTDGYVRMNQLAEQLNVQVPSATKTVQRLSKLGLVDYKKYGIIQLTDKGEEIGEFLLERHRIIEQFLKNLGVIEPDILLKDTETIEHNISVSTLRNLELFNSFLDVNPDVVERFERYMTIQRNANQVYE
jgi:DtxR family Mn-dependent transcriptional regulator